MSFLTSLVSVEDGGSVSTSVRMSCMENRRINTEIEKGKLKEKKKGGKQFSEKLECSYSQEICKKKSSKP